jgi:hypothetical protein
MDYELIEAGENFERTFSENLSTGYRTYIMTSPEISIVSDTYKSSGSAPGAGGNRVVVFTSNTPGIYFISSINVRSWENQPAACSIIKVEVVEPKDILRVTLYISKQKIVGYHYNDNYYNPDGTLSNAHIRYNSKIPVKLPKSTEYTKFTFYDDRGELTYNVDAKDCLRSAKTNSVTKCYDDLSKIKTLGSITISNGIGKSNDIDSSDVLFFKKNKLVGYSIKGHTKKASSWDYKIGLNIPDVDIVSITFYKYKKDIIYLIDPGCCDRLKCLYNSHGKKMGCPLGGFTGKGDGSKIPEGATMIEKINLSK